MDSELDPRDLEDDDLDRLLNTLDIVTQFSGLLHDLLRSPACCATYRLNCSQYLKCLKIFSRPSTPITPRFGSDTRIGPKTYKKRRDNNHKE